MLNIFLFILLCVADNASKKIFGNVPVVITCCIHRINRYSENLFVQEYKTDTEDAFHNATTARKFKVCAM